MAEEKKRSVWEAEQEMIKQNPKLGETEFWSKDCIATPEDEEMMEKEFPELFKKKQGN